MTGRSMALGQAGMQPGDLGRGQHAIDPAGLGGIEQDDAIALDVDDLVDLAGLGDEAIAEHFEE